MSIIKVLHWIIHCQNSIKIHTVSVVRARITWSLQWLGYRLDDVGLKSWQGQAIRLVLEPTRCLIGSEIFCNSPNGPWGPWNLLYKNGYLASFLRVKWPGYGIDHHTQTALSYTSTTTTPPPNTFMACYKVDVPLTSLCIILAYLYMIPGESSHVSIGCVSVYLLFLYECTLWTLSTNLG
jgi:hypothetical protein